MGNGRDAPGDGLLDNHTSDCATSWPSAGVSDGAIKYKIKEQTKSCSARKCIPRVNEMVRIIDTRTHNLLLRAWASNRIELGYVSGHFPLIFCR